LSCPQVKKSAVNPVWDLGCFRATWRSILFLTVGFIVLRCDVPFSVQESIGLFVGRDHLMFSLCLPSSAHLSASSFRGSPWCAFILMKTAGSRWSMRSRRSCTMSLMMSASGMPHMEVTFPSPVYFWEEDRKHGEFDRRIIGFLSSFPSASSNARQAAPRFRSVGGVASSPLSS